MATLTKGRATQVGPDPTNGAEPDIDTGQPYVVRVTIRGTADILFHRWNCEAVAEKANAKKGSAVKKVDNIESYVYRDDGRRICVPGEYLRGAIIGASKFRQDPRSPRKSAMDLYKAAIVPMTAYAPILVDGRERTEWEYEHACRVQVQRNGVTRVRPAFKKGWECVIDLMCNVPQYIDRDSLHDVIVDAGRLIGIADFRPTYGRFAVTKFEDAIEDN
jgi:hypothetical protein